ncbi:hypothetical protein SAMN05421847_2139 [Halpernia humi]|uniref:Uncharacterized protein n=1 Tax=Halpernia humi TaxID=493375 RepID=A0A1H5ZPG6_9FLAO|nr:hypothetical protein SAMN05421847_2139 [Halpernia humi]
MLNILYGIGAILIGIYFIWSTSKMELTKSSYRSNVLFKGYGSAIGFIILGIVLIVRELLK